ncbi:SMP-30/gluconolactonase/LRE family protein [Vibrio mediterranei]|uniref:SMP-30/gluconolactonase/LRE family protein n=1 Tax=Vibrio mediterranei TaxID=689 RepID=UPI004067B1AF
MTIDVLDTPSAILGEGIFFDDHSRNLYWVDIVGNQIFQYSTFKQELTAVFDVPLNPSCIFDLEDNKLIYTNNKGVARLDLGDGQIEQLSNIAHDNRYFRTNDGTKLSDGGYIFGTMGFQPDNKSGNIYKTDSQGSTDIFYLGIHIPNTFIELDNEILISDSLKKVTYSYSKNLTAAPAVWADFSNEAFTPDGGTLINNSKVYIAMWGGAKVMEMTLKGEVVRSINLPALQPTNCIFTDDNLLYITTAKEGLDETQLANYPLSGRTFRVDLGSIDEK